MNVRQLPRHGNKPEYVYRGERLVPFSPDWESDDPYGEMPADHAVLLVDATTGAELAMYAWEDYRTPAKLDWADVARRYFQCMATDAVTASEVRVAMWLFGELGFGNAGVFGKSDLAKNLGISRSTLTKAISALVGRSAVVQVEVGGPRRLLGYRLNANYGATAEHAGKPDWLRQEHEALDAVASDCA